MSEKRILIVDDDDAIRALLHTLLRRRGYIADTARNGIEALERVAASRYALVVLDIMMPRMNGWEFLEHLRRISVVVRPRVLLLTAGIEARALDPELVVGTIHKPFDLDLLVDTVSGFLHAASGPMQLEERPPAGAVTATPVRPN